MKILVSLKRVIDPYVKVRLRADQTGVELSNIKMSPNPFDMIALEEAIRIKEKEIAKEIVVISVGSLEVVETIRVALAMGADRGIHIEASQSLPPLQIAKCLKSIVEREEPELVILGKQSIDGDNNQTGQMLAALLDWPQGTFVSKIDFLGSKLQITREVDEGLEILELQIPAVITTDLRLNEPRYPTLPNIMKSKQKPILHISMEELGIAQHANLRVIRFEEPVIQKQMIKVDSAEELIEKLKFARVLS